MTTISDPEARSVVGRAIATLRLARFLLVMPQIFLLSSCPRLVSLCSHSYLQITSTPPTCKPCWPYRHPPTPRVAASCSYQHRHLRNAHRWPVEVAALAKTCGFEDLEELGEGEQTATEVLERIRFHTILPRASPSPLPSCSSELASQRCMPCRTTQNPIMAQTLYRTHSEA